MIGLLVKCLLIATGFILQLLLRGSSVTAVVCALVAIILAGLSDALTLNTATIKKRAYGLLLILALLWCALLPEAAVYMPILVFEIASEGSVVLLVMAAAAIVPMALTSGVMIAVLVVGLSLIAMVMNYLISEVNKLNNYQHRLRDSATEREILIERSNRNLRDSQDANVYAATLKERNRIAREIHDNVGHMLTRSILQAGAIRTINKNEVLDKPLSELSDTLNQAMTSIRQSVHDLHDESINLRAAMEELTETTGDMKVILDYDMSNDVSKDIKYSFLAITKEAINNAVKHSNGDTISVVAREHPGFYQLLISDNGVVSEYNDENGIGLSNIKDRVDALHGRLKITTDGGFKILITIMK